MAVFSGFLEDFFLFCFSFYIRCKHLLLKPNTTLFFSQKDGPLHLQSNFPSMKQRRKGLSAFDTYAPNLIYEHIWKAHTQLAYLYSLSEAKIGWVAPNYRQQIPNIFHIVL